MKKTITTITLGFIFSLSSFATVWTVSNNPNRRTQFTNLTDAHTIASNFDTIYVYGSGTPYTNVTISKRLVIMGPGYNVQASNPENAIISDLTLSGGSSNTILLGLTINAILPDPSSTINNLLIKCSRIGSIGTSTFGQLISNNHSNWIIENNIISDRINISQGYSSIPLTIRNNIINGMIDGTSNNLLVIQNNLFISTSASNRSFLSNLRRATIKNNIFFGRSPDGADSSTFINNITWDIATGYQQNLPYGTNTGAGNINMTDPLFVNAINKDATNYNNNFRIISTSPAKNAGNDGTDIGPTDGVSPIYPTSTGQLTGMPPIPTITQMNLPVNAAPQGGNIQLFMRGKRNY